MAYVRSSDPISNIEPDEGSEVDNDSAFNGSLGSASYQTSISSSVKNYKYENGRRYHAFREGEYVLPNDEEEQDRMDLGHHIYLLLLKGKLYRAPLPPNPQRVLDLGTGTGIWAIDFAEVPANCVFEVDDYESPWPYSQNFDFIHGRELLGFVGDFDRLFAQAMKNLKPGGYLEMQTAEAQAFSDDGTMEKAVNCLKWVAELRGASEKFGKSMSCVDTWEERMRNAGFVDVTRDVFKLPLSPWPKDPFLKEIGRYQQVQQIQALGSYSLALFTRVLGWTREETEVLLAGVRGELRDRSIHWYLKVHFVYGRRP